MRWNELEARKSQENQQIQAEMDRIVAEHRARMQANNDAVAKEKERFFAWRLKKQEEEQKIADAVSYFVAENPITTGGPAAAPAPSRNYRKVAAERELDLCGDACLAWSVRSSDSSFPSVRIRNSSWSRTSAT